MKNGLMIVSFVGEENTPYFKSSVFMKLLEKVTAQPDRFVLRPKGTRLAMTIRRVSNIEEGYNVLKSL